GRIRVSAHPPSRLVVMSASPLTWRSSSVLARRRVQVAAALACAAVLLLVAGMFVYDHARRDLIANGVRIDGVPVGGMRESAALEKVQRQLAGSLRRPVTVRSRPLTWTLGAREADLRIDARTMVRSEERRVGTRGGG